MEKSIQDSIHGVIKLEEWMVRIVICLKVTRCIWEGCGRVLRRVVAVLLVLVMLGSAVMPVMATKALTDTLKSSEKAKIVLELMMHDKKNAEKIFENLPPETQREVIELLKVKSIVVKTGFGTKFPDQSLRITT